MYSLFPLAPVAHLFHPLTSRYRKLVDAVVVRFDAVVFRFAAVVVRFAAVVARFAAVVVRLASQRGTFFPCWICLSLLVSLS